MSEADDMQRIQAIARMRKAGTINKGIDRVLRLLEQARQHILSEVMDSDWDRLVLPRLLRNVDAAIEQWRTKAIAGLAEAQAEGWSAGTESAALTIDALGMNAALPNLPESLLHALERRGAQAVTGLASFGRVQIDSVIATSVLAGADRQSVIDAIGAVLTKADVSGRPQGKFGTLRARAEFIYRQEVGAAFAAAKNGRDEQAMGYAPELKKIWRHCGAPKEPRQGHQLMHGQERGRTETFENPLTGAALAYPRDPGAVIGETANCTCDTVLWRELYGDKWEFIACSGSSASPRPITRTDDRYNPAGYLVPDVPVVSAGQP